MTGEPLLCDGHANTRCDALSQGPCSRLYARRPMVLGVAGRLAVELAEAADVVKRNRWPPQRFIVLVHGPCAAAMKRRPEEPRSMAVPEYQSITIGPDRILRIEAQDAIPDCVDQRRERHRRAGVPGFGLLHCVDRKRADGVDAQLIEFRICQMAHSSCRAHGRLLSLVVFVSSKATLARRRRWRSA